MNDGETTMRPLREPPVRSPGVILTGDKCARAFFESLLATPPAEARKRRWYLFPERRHYYLSAAFECIEVGAIVATWSSDVIWSLAHTAGAWELVVRSSRHEGTRFRAHEVWRRVAVLGDDLRS